MPVPLLTTKNHIPHARRTPVSRPRLLTRLDAGLRCPLTLLAAPAGFGKTTLLCDWLAQRHDRVSWVTLDEGDNDPARFWAYVIAALETLQPAVGDSALSLLVSSPPGSIEAILTALINALDALPCDVVLVLDDYHTVDNDQIHGAMTFLISHLPLQMHIYVATRSDPPLPLALWRARGDLNELRAADLRFMPEETRQFLRTSMGETLTDDEIAALDARTEGWIAGLQLAVLALRLQDSERVPDFIAASAVSNRFLADYLIDEVLRNQSERVRDFLRQTSILDRLSAPLCDAVTGKGDSESLLDYLDRASLFLTPLDAVRQWFRYHKLIADLLRKLLAQEQPDRVPELHRRASEWFEAHESVGEAIIHALAGGDDERAARLIEGAARTFLRRGEVGTLSDWLAALPEQVMLAHPALCTYKALALIRNGQFEQAKPWLKTAEQRVDTMLALPETAELRGRIATLRAILAAQAGDVTAMVDQARLALANLPKERAFMRGLSSWVQGLAYLLNDQVTQASQTFGELMGTALAAGHAPVALLATYAFGLLETTRGRLTLAAEMYQQALQFLASRNREPGPIAGLVYLGFGELLRLRDDLDIAERYLLEGLRLTQGWLNHSAQAQGLISLAWVRWARADAGGALAAIQQALQPGATRISREMLAQVKAQQARLWLLQSNVFAAQLWAHENAPQNDTTVRGLSHLFLDQETQATRARLLLAECRPIDALAILTPLSASTKEAGWVRISVILLGLSALCEHALGETEGAIAYLRQALVLAEPEGYVRVFADEGQGMADLLMLYAQRAGEEPRLSAFAQRVIAACRPRPIGVALIAASPGALHDGQRQALGTTEKLVEALTDREQEILRLLAAGLSNREIAERLSLSIGTVKTHTHNLYAKLSVGDRVQALLRARDLRLL